jgi:hypothetical protein
MPSTQCIVSSMLFVRRKGAIRSRISCGQRQLAGAIGVTISYALGASSGQENLLRAPSPQIVHEGRVRGIRGFGGYGGLAASPTFVMQSCMTAGDFQSYLWQGIAVSCFQGVCSGRCCF